MKITYVCKIVHVLFETTKHYLCVINKFPLWNKCFYLRQNMKCISSYGLGVRVMVFNTNFNNISVILWWSALLVETALSPDSHIGCQIKMKWGIYFWGLHIHHSCKVSVQMVLWILRKRNMLWETAMSCGNHFDIGSEQNEEFFLNDYQ